jgi:hypothetical protein
MLDGSKARLFFWNVWIVNLVGFSRGMGIFETIYALLNGRPSFVLSKL